jgi:hypothetical protein
MALRRIAYLRFIRTTKIIGSIYSVQISTIPSAQNWLNQFLPEDRKIAEKLLNQLVYVASEDVINDLGSQIARLIEKFSKVAVFPIREIEKIAIDGADDTTSKQLKSYFSLDNNDVVPELQSAENPLGSEAFVSNLVTQLSRRYKKKVMSYEANKTNPSINNLRKERVDALILVDDLIGSGKRTLEFLESIYQHPTIKSWLSGKQIEIHIVSFMASKKGEDLVRRWTMKHKNSQLHVLNSCPMIEKVQADIYKLCFDYADKKERFPIGFGDNPVRVVFSHSAPNNLPAILYRNSIKLKTNNKELRARIKSWKALFEGRAITETLKIELSSLKPLNSIKSLFIELLDTIGTNPGLSENALTNLFSGSNSQLNLCKERCLNYGWIEEREEKLFLTDTGKKEQVHISKNKSVKVVANNQENYYPEVVSQI